MLDKHTYKKVFQTETLQYVTWPFCRMMVLGVRDKNERNK